MCFRPHQGINKFNAYVYERTIKMIKIQVSVPIRGSINLTLTLLIIYMMHISLHVSVPIRGSINLTLTSSEKARAKKAVRVSVPIRGSINLT